MDFVVWSYFAVALYNSSSHITSESTCEIAGISFFLFVFVTFVVIVGLPSFVVGVIPPSSFFFFVFSFLVLLSVFVSIGCNG